MRTPKVNVGFECGQCGHSVPPHPSSSRDHCNMCLHSKHVDVLPGDRKNPCKGDLEPIGLIKKGDREQIVYRCKCCGEGARNVVAPDDNRQRLIELSANPIPYDMLSPKTIAPADERQGTDRRGRNRLR